MELKKFAKARVKKGKKSALPWALARGITSGAAGALYGLVPAIGTAIATKKMPSLKSVGATSALGALTGLGVGFGKGFAEKRVETSIAKALKKNKKK